MEQNKYWISEDQFDQLVFFKDRFDDVAEELKMICEKEMYDINLGFEMGQMYVRCRQFFLDFSDLRMEIAKQEILPL